MSSRILLPLEGSGTDDQAMAWADHLASTLKAEVTILRVVRPLDEARNQVHIERVRATLKYDGEKFSRAKLAGAEVLAGRPGQVIAEYARDYDIVLMVSNPRWDNVGAVSGLVTTEVIRESGVPVLVIPSDLAARAPRIPRRILVPVDMTETSASVIPTVLPLSEQLRAEVILFSAVEPGRASQAPTQVAGYLHGLSLGFHRRQIGVRTVTRLGPPGPTIVDFAHEGNVDLIAMATGGAHDPGLLLHLGPVTEYVFSRSGLPMLALQPARAEVSREAPHDALAGAAVGSGGGEP